MTPAAAAPSRVVVDTDVLSFTFKGDTRRQLYRPHLARRGLFISFQTMAELDAWALSHRWRQRRRDEMEEHLARRYTVVRYTRDLAPLWAFATVEAERVGQPIEAGDAWIAATALLFRIPLVTHNPGDFAGVPGLMIITEQRA